VRYQYSPAGIDSDTAKRVAEILQDRLIGLIDMSLAVKHAHWNVIGPGFISAHELFDSHVAEIRAMADEVAERISTLGGIPNGLPGFIVDRRGWDDYAIGRGVVEAHLGALDKVYDMITEGHRRALLDVAGDDVVTADLLTGQTRKLELMQWFLRAHLESTSGRIPTTDEETMLDAASAAATSDPLS
jgi:starvation-inducible DNA-binding protein